MHSTAPLAIGFQSDTVLLASTWARFDLGSPPTDEKLPPRYQPPAPSGTTLFTLAGTPRAVTRGKSGAAIPVAESIGAPPPVEGPIWVNAPPMKSVLPDSTAAFTGPLVT